MAQKFLFLVKTGIFDEFLKCGFLFPRPGKRETGPSDVIPGHKHQANQQRRRVVL